MNFLNQINNLITPQGESSPSSLSKDKKLIQDVKKWLGIIQRGQSSTSSDQSLLKALENLAILCTPAENKEILCADEDLALFIIVTLKQLLQSLNTSSEQENETLLIAIIDCLNRFSVDDSTNYYLSSSDLEILPILVKTLKSTSNTKLIFIIESTISNCSIAGKNELSA
jgi:hypothetical protein